MKILHVFPFFSLKFAGGTVDLIYKLSRAQVKQGHEVTVYTGDYNLDRDYMNSLKGVQIHTFKSWLNFGFYLMPNMMKHARSHLRSFDIVHLHCYRSFQNWVIHHFADKYKIPYVLDAHGSVRVFSRKVLLKKFFDVIYGHKILRDAGKVIAETETGAKEYRKMNVEDNKICLLSPPFDTDEFSQLPPYGQFRSQFGIQKKNMVAFLGRVHWIKGIDFLVESFAMLIDKRKDVVLVIVGADDGFKANLEELIRRLHLEQDVLFAGFVSHEQKLSALVDADVVVQTSRFEEGAWAPFEAVLCQTPIIVNGATGAGEDVKKIDAGYLVEFGNKKDLCDKIQYVLDNPDETAAKTRKAKHFIEDNLSMRSRIGEYDDLYISCIDNK